ncbi:MAG: 5-formyltetrahydrofolate cyclo-ligase [Rhodocyclaceae bacterium]|nr:5-formyltetrahydrofolate cyclo-ligase [Rhodocyclaceae bacterium]
MPEDRTVLRQRLLRERAAMPPEERARRSAALQQKLLAWLAQRAEVTLGAYWPIRGEFDPLPAVQQWLAGDVRRRAALPVSDKRTRTMRFVRWQPGGAMAADDYGIPIPAAGEEMAPALLLVPCVGFGEGGARLGYGGGFYDRALAVLHPRPFALGLGFSIGFVAAFAALPHDQRLDAVLTDDGLRWPQARL